MAAELEIVVRARDQITETLRRIGTNVDRLTQQVVSEFKASGGAVDHLALGLAGAGTAAGTFGTQAGAAAQSAAALGKVNVDPLQASIAATRTEIERIAKTVPVSPEAVQRMADLEAEARRAEQAIAGVGNVEIDIVGKVAQAQQAFERLGAQASLVPLQAEIARARSEVDRLENAARQAGGKLSELDKTRVDELKRGIREGEAALVGMRTGATQVAATARTMGTAFTGAGAAIKSALLPLLPIFGLAGAAFFAKNAAEDSLAFTAALGQIRTEGSLTEAEIAVLGETARATARSLGLSDADAAPTLLAAVTDGAENAADGLERYNAALRLSTVTGGEVKRTTDVLTSVLNAYARQGLGAARASDVLFEVTRVGKVEIDALAGGLEGVLPLASQLGIRFEELGAVLVTATKQGGGFEQGVQAIRATLGALTSISDEGAEALRGIDYSSAAIRARGLVPVLSDISARLRGNSDAIRAVFPDGRSFGALLAILANDGRDLSDSLAQLAGSSGAVEDALGRRLQSPLVRLGKIFNDLRSNLGEALGSAFLRGVDRAIEALGGMEATSRAVADVAKALGSVLGEVFPSIATVVAEATLGLKSFIDGIGGADAIAGRMRIAGDAIADILGAALKIARAEVEALMRAIFLIPQAVIAIKNELDPARLNPFRDAAAEAAIVKREIDAVSKALLQVKGQTLRFGAFDLEEFQGSLRKISDELGSFKDDPANALRFKSVVDEGDLEQVLESLRRKSASIQVELDAGGSFEELQKSFAEASKSVGADMDAALAQMEQGWRGFGNVFTADVAKPVERTLSTVREDLAGVTESIAIAKEELRFLGGAAVRAFSEMKGEELKDFLRELAARASGVDKALGSNEESARRLNLELAGLVAADIAATEGGIRLLESTLRDAASQAALLGLQGNQAAEAVAAVGTSEDERRLQALRDHLAGLKAELSGLRSLAPESLVSGKRFQAPGFREMLDQAIAGAKELAARVASVFDPATMARLGRESGDALQKGILASVQTIDPFEETLKLFRGGIEPSLQRQADAVDRQVSRQRDATDELRNSLPMLRSLGLLDEARLASLEQATDELDKQADSLRDQAAEIRRGLRLEAIALGIEPTLDEDELRKEISRVRERTALETEAIRLGVSVALDDEALTASVRDARAALDRGLADIQRDQFEREAIRLGVSLDSDSLELDVARARDDAQAFADALQGAGLRREAITLGIDISGRSIEQIRHDIASVRNEADAFAAQNPIASEALVSGIRGFGNAIGAIASGAQTAKEALSSFFQSFVQQVAGAIAQALLLKAIIAAVGGPASGPGAFLTAAFGSKEGNVFPARRGLAVPGLAAAAIAMAPVVAYAQGGAPDFHARLTNPIAFSQGEAPVQALALGGAPSTPHLNRVVSAPTYAPLSSLSGAAVVPLSGGGVETTSGARLPVTKRGGELVVAAASGIEIGLGRPGQAGAVPLAAGAAPQALYGEAGPEAIMRTYAAPGGGPGLRMESGGVAPLTRVAGGRLGLALADGAALSLGGLPGLNLTDLRRSIRTDIEPFALGGIPDAFRHVRTLSENYRPAVRAPIVPLALGGLPAAAAQVIQARPVAPVSVSVPVTVNVQGGAAQQATQEDPRQLEARLQAAISNSPRVREALAAVVSREMEARPAFRANVRGDRA